ncbi:hypothetical protein [Cellulosimicrobium protaetiae]|uniref:Uncharacterized protein n=1 Tax=Cellulosimicrobium protaetiae TaxID=2587808 RepID=A0A6M5UGI5_9MICO|nr:hypothetical protein [Cellulosimicrobium protaetiae]QJW37676.1 hypothetical protein FIC82_017310 [Cellulosimicrobium protaetiae]
MTTTRRLLAALVLAGSLLVPVGAAAAAPSVGTTPDPSDGVRVSVEITEREVPAGPRVVVVGEGPFVAGGELVVRGTGLAPRTTYEVWLESDPVLLGTVTTDGDGAFELATTIPVGTAPGEHHVRLVAPGEADVLSEPFTVLAATGEPGGTPSTGTGGTTGGGTSATPRPGGLATTGTGLVGAAVLAGLAVAAGAVLRRRADRGRATS